MYKSMGFCHTAKKKRKKLHLILACHHLPMCKSHIALHTVSSRVNDLTHIMLQPCTDTKKKKFHNSMTNMQQTAISFKPVNLLPCKLSIDTYEQCLVVN